MKRNITTFLWWSLLMIAIWAIVSFTISGWEAASIIGVFAHYLDISLFVLFGVISAAIIAFSVAR